GTEFLHDWPLAHPLSDAAAPPLSCAGALGLNWGWPLLVGASSQVAKTRRRDYKLSTDRDYSQAGQRVNANSPMVIAVNCCDDRVSSAGWEIALYLSKLS